MNFEHLTNRCADLYTITCNDTFTIDDANGAWHLEQRHLPFPVFSPDLRVSFVLIITVFGFQDGYTKIII